MSKTTFFKRIALTAIAALGLGMLSVAPSQAVVQNLVVTGANGTSTLTSGFKSDSTTAATVSVSALLESGDSITVAFIEKSKPTGATAIARLYYHESSTPTGVTVVDSMTVANGVTTSGAAVVRGFLTGNDTLTGVAAAGDLLRIRNNAIATPGYAGAKFFVQLDSTSARIAGTYTYTVTVKAYNSQGTANVPASTTSTDVSIVVADSAANIALTGATAIDPSKTTAILNAGAPSSWSTTDSSVSAVSTADATNHASIRVRTYTADSNPAPESVTATVTGPGLVCNSDASVCGKNLTIVGAAGDNTFRVRADGAAGSASIVIKTTTVTFPAKTVTFYAKAAKTITLAVNKPVISVGTNTDVIRATALDADGNVWGGTAYILADSAADALIASSTTPVACTFSATLGVHQCPVSGTAKGTAKVEVIDAATVALATATSATADVRVSTGVATTAKISFDKATYEPGEKAQLRISILDGEGLAMPATTVTNAFAADLVSSRAFGSGSASLSGSTTVVLQAATSASLDTNAGHQTYVVYMPSTAGAITVSGTGSTGLALAGRVAVSGTATVVDSSNQPAIDAATAATDAALEAIDAANAATDAANLAAEAADAATVAAEEARDAADAATAAVEALASEVATLIAGLKAQITTLANTVAKIAKKVKA